MNEHLFFSICFALLAIVQILIAVKRRERMLLVLAVGWLALALAWFLRR
jgi:hypothetical protein